MLTDVEQIYLAALAQACKGKRNQWGRWKDRHHKPWTLAAGDQSANKAGLSWDIRRAVLREIANKLHTPRREADRTPQNQADGLPSKSRPRLRSVKSSLEMTKPSKVRRINPKQLRPTAVKA